MNKNGEISSVPSNPSSDLSSRMIKGSILPMAALFTLLAPMAPMIANAADATTADATPKEKVVLGPPPSDWGLSFKDYYADTQKLVNHMRYAVQLEKGDPALIDVAQKTKEEMGDFVSYYRRLGGVNGKQSYSLLYTSVNVLSGHYASYGIKFPVPEKRRKRLLQEFNDIEKNIRKKR
eukprot:gene9901-13321_t